MPEAADVDEENRARYDRSKLRYPSDLTDEEWAHAPPLIPPAMRGGTKRSVDEREVVNGLMYIPRHRGLAVLRAPARGQRRRRALHPYAEGKPALGAPRRDHQGAWRCSNSPTGTTSTGWSPVIATGHPPRSGPTSSRPWIRPHERCSRLSHNRGAVQLTNCRLLAEEVPHVHL